MCVIGCRIILVVEFIEWRIIEETINILTGNLFKELGSCIWKEAFNPWKGSHIGQKAIGCMIIWIRRHLVMYLDENLVSKPTDFHICLTTSIMQKMK